MNDPRSPRADHAIWLYAFGYFACYAPYSALTKVVSDGKIPGMARGLTGFELLPITTLASFAGMFVFLTWKGWWGHAGRRTILGRSLPFPGRYTFLSGLCSAAIIGTTTFAYTIHGASIVFMMLLMRGGVLAIAPLVDLISRRKVRLAAWFALACSISALFLAVSSSASFVLPPAAVLDVSIYLLAYFIRLQFMSRLAKSDDRGTMLRYFVEEQLVASPAIVFVLALLATIGQGEAMLAIRQGFVGIWGQGAGIVVLCLAIGFLSQGTGIYGGLILLDGRENTFCVPVNRASSVLAGLLASYALWLLVDAKPVPARELAGAALVLVAITVLASASVRKPKPAIRPAPAPQS